MGAGARARFIAVVVPAHDEEARIGRCLDALNAARRHGDVRHLDVRLIVVLDSCLDGTEAVARALLGVNDRLVAMTATNVGAARRTGFALALQLSRPLPSQSVWLASTDADSAVGPDWLARQIHWRSLGFDGVAGTVKVDSWSQHSARTRSRYHAHMAGLGTGVGHPHVHGTNLAFSADAYTAVGGIPAIATGEDRAIWDSLGSGGFRRAAVDDLVVITSGRSVGRAPDGFSSLLARMSTGAAATERP
jgi:glycosyltransferase involved in cell wall biosynthesis